MERSPNTDSQEATMDIDALIAALTTDPEMAEELLHVAAEVSAERENLTADELTDVLADYLQMAD